MTNNTIKFVTPEVTLIAATALVEQEGKPVIAEDMELDPDATDGEHLVEYSGRICYQSTHKPNPATRKNRDYIESTVIEKEHGSVSEHAVATLRFRGISRSLTHELVRHRHFSYSQLSQRFVNEDDTAFILPPLFRDNKDIFPDEKLNELAGALSMLMEQYKSMVEAAVEGGAKRKQAREAARMILPNATDTEIIITGNMRAWKIFIDRRTAPDADAEIQEVAGMAKQVLAEVFPSLFTD